MFPYIRYVRKITGWLNFSASLFLIFSIFQATDVAGQDNSPAERHKQVEALVDGTPFEQVFSGESDLVVLTFFDLYCVACQQSAQNFNRLHDRLQKELAEFNVQVTGVGIGDTPFELSVFLKKYQLPYLCIPDPEKTFEKPFAIRGTPTVLVFERKNMDCLEVYRHEGRFRSDDANSLVDELKTRLLTK